MLITVQSLPGNCSSVKKYLAFTLVGIATDSALPCILTSSMLPYSLPQMRLMKPGRRRCGNPAGNDCMYCLMFILLYGASVNIILLFFTQGPNAAGSCMPCPADNRSMRAGSSDAEQ
jgi:hypothetical protein